MEQELLYKYFKGTASEEEEKLILNWVDASPENRKAFQKERMLYDIALFTDEKQINRRDKKKPDSPDVEVECTCCCRTHRSCQLWVIV